MSDPIIADSSALVSLVSKDDQNHKIAVQVSKDYSQVRTLIIIPSDVFSETLNVIGRKLGHSLAISLGREIINSETYTVIETDEALRDKALGLFANQPRSVSFTDCVVMAFAEQFQTKDIFGFDEVFAKKGYHRLGFDKE